MKSEQARMKSSACRLRWYPHFVRVNPPLTPAARQISSRSDFIHRRWISSANGGFNWKKTIAFAIVFFLGRGRRIRTRDPRFWSGSKSPKILENPRFFARFNTFFSQDRVSQLCLKKFDAFLMLWENPPFIIGNTVILMLFKNQNLRCSKQRKVFASKKFRRFKTQKNYCNLLLQFSKRQSPSLSQVVG